MFFPYLLNGVAIGFIFLYFYKGGGTLDTVLTFFGLGDEIQLWLGNRSINNISLAFTSVWRYTGFNFLVFLGAIQSVNPEIYEAAEIDGANQWDKFRYIIVPSIKKIIFLNVILGIGQRIAQRIRYPIHHDGWLERNDDFRHPNDRNGIQVQQNWLGIRDGYHPACNRDCGHGCPETGYKGGKVNDGNDRNNAKDHEKRSEIGMDTWEFFQIYHPLDRGDCGGATVVGRADRIVQIQ